MGMKIKNIEFNQNISKGMRYATTVPMLYSDKEDCCGCYGCFSACGLDAIEMSVDEEGFRYPVIDAEKCVRCGKCVKACPIKQFDNMFSDVCK